VRIARSRIVKSTNIEQQLQEIAAMKMHISTKLVVITVAVICALLAWRAASAEDLSTYRGAELYQRFCASCHGTDGRGDGPVAPALKILVPDLTRLTRRRGDDFPLERVRRIIDGRDIFAAHGSRQMPIWGYEFATATSTEPDAGASTAATLIDRLVDFLKGIQRNDAARPQ
jgi:mono/diheme cytochrome c family protein